MRKTGETRRLNTLAVPELAEICETLVGKLGIDLSDAHTREYVDEALGLVIQRMTDGRRREFFVSLNQGGSFPPTAAICLRNNGRPWSAWHAARLASGREPDAALDGRRLVGFYLGHEINAAHTQTIYTKLLPLLRRLRDDSKDQPSLPFAFP